MNENAEEKASREFLEARRLDSLAKNLGSPRDELDEKLNILMARLGITLQEILFIFTPEFRQAHGLPEPPPLTATMAEQRDFFISQHLLLVDELYEVLQKEKVPTSVSQPIVYLMTRYGEILAEASGIAESQEFMEELEEEGF